MNAFCLENTCTADIDFSSRSTVENSKLDLILADRWRADITGFASCSIIPFFFHAYIVLTL